MELGIARALQHGSCIVALGNSHHLGRIGAWAEQATRAGLVSLHFVNVIARSIVAPYGGADARFGTPVRCRDSNHRKHAGNSLDSQQACWRKAKRVLRSIRASSCRPAPCSTIKAAPRASRVRR